MCIKVNISSRGDKIIFVQKNNQMQKAVCVNPAKVRNDDEMWYDEQMGIKNEMFFREVFPNNVC